MCGENPSTIAFVVSAAGSSPRVRGKPAKTLQPLDVEGLIPACAGKTLPAYLMHLKRWAHPRVCGENPARRLALGRITGSSPRVRGKLQAEATRVRATEAHPRVCGENTLLAPYVVFEGGSSPRVRGKREGSDRLPGEGGLIPACAGKTSRSAIKYHSVWAHPRVCGENTERSGVLTLRSVRSWKTLSFPSSLKATHCRTFMQLWLSRIRL